MTRFRRIRRKVRNLLNLPVWWTAGDSWGLRHVIVNGTQYKSPIMFTWNRATNGWLIWFWHEGTEDSLPRWQRPAKVVMPKPRKDSYEG